MSWQVVILQIPPTPHTRGNVMKTRENYVANAMRGYDSWATELRKYINDPRKYEAEHSRQVVNCPTVHMKEFVKHRVTPILILQYAKREGMAAGELYDYAEAVKLMSRTKRLKEVVRWTIATVRYAPERWFSWDVKPGSFSPIPEILGSNTFETSNRLYKTSLAKCRLAAGAKLEKTL